jgi:hypothetical protein
LTDEAYSVQLYLMRTSQVPDTNDPNIDATIQYALCDKARFMKRHRTEASSADHCCSVRTGQGDDEEGAVSEWSWAIHQQAGGKFWKFFDSVNS